MPPGQYVRGLSVEERIWSQIDKRGPDECWLWTGRLSQHGYGTVKIAGRYRFVHREVLERAGGLPAGLCALHCCEDRYAPGDITCRRCCNPAHLRAGSHQENMRDRDAAGRGRGGGLPGEACGQAKLTDEAVLEIRALYAAGGVRQKDLAAQFGVTQTTVQRAVRRTCWRHI